MTNARIQTTGKKALSAGIWYTVSNLMIRGVNLITAPIFTNFLLTKAQIGDFNNYVSVMTLLTIVTTFDLYTSVNRAHYDYGQDLDGYMSAITVQSTLITGVFYLLCVVFGDFAQTIFSMDMRSIHVMFIYILTAPAIQILQAKHRLDMRYKAFVLISSVTVLGNALLSVGLILLMNDAYMGRLIGSVLPTVVLGIGIYCLLLFRGKTFFKKEYWRNALSISLPLVPHLVSTTILAQFSRMMVKNMRGSAAAGEFSTVCNLMLILVLLWNSFNNAWQPWSMERMNKKEYAKLRRTSRAYMGLFYVLVGGLVAIGPEVLALFGSGYVNNNTLFPMPLILLSAAFQFTASMYVNVEVFEKKTLFASMATILAACVNIVLNLLLIPRLGALGAGISMLVGYILLLVFHYAFSRRIEKERLYDEKFMLVGLLILLAFSGLMTLLYSTIMLRYGMLTVALLLVVFLMRRDIGVILKIFLKKEEKKKPETE